jgi:hypothetical protein
MFESCLEIRDFFSDYLDGCCSRESTRSLRFHLQYCAACREELERAEGLQAALRELPRQPVPRFADLNLKVRVSQELNRNLAVRLLVRVQNLVQDGWLPASGGLAVALVSFCLFLGALAVPVNTGPDVPLWFETPAQVLALAPMNFDTGDEPVTVVTDIDATGRAISYTVVSGKSSPALDRHLDRLLHSSRFLPATWFGKPTQGKVVLALREITVRG